MSCMFMLSTFFFCILVTRMYLLHDSEFVNSIFCFWQPPEVHNLAITEPDQQPSCIYFTMHQAASALTAEVPNRDPSRSLAMSLSTLVNSHLGLGDMRGETGWIDKHFNLFVAHISLKQNMFLSIDSICRWYSNLGEMKN